MSAPINLRVQDNCCNCKHAVFKKMDENEPMINCLKHEMLANQLYALNHVCDDYEKELKGQIK